MTANAVNIAYDEKRSSEINPKVLKCNVIDIAGLWKTHVRIIYRKKIKQTGSNLLAQRKRNS